MSSAMQGAGMIRRAVGLLFISAGIVLSLETEAGETLLHKGESSIEISVSGSQDDDLQFHHSDIRTWYVVDVAYDGCKPQVVLLKNTERSETSAFAMEASTEVKGLEIVARIATESGAGPQLYTLNLIPYWRGEGTVDVVADAGYLSVMIGGEFAPYQIFDLLTGKFLLLADDYHSTASIHRGEECEAGRYVAATTRDLDHQDNRAGADVIALVTYSSPDGPLQRAKIEATREAHDELMRSVGGEFHPDAGFVAPGSLGKVPIGRLPQKKTDAQTFDRISIWVRLDEKVAIEIPVSRDRLDVAKAILPAGYSIDLIE
jgi:hypothetical protein